MTERLPVRKIGVSNVGSCRIVLRGLVCILTACANLTPSASKILNSAAFDATLQTSRAPASVKVKPVLLKQMREIGGGE